MTHNPLDQLQEKLAFLERANAELDAVVCRQQRDIEHLAAQLRALTERWQAAQSAEHPLSPEEERPPHY